MHLPPFDPQKLPGESPERRLTYAKYSEVPEILRVLSTDPFWFVRDFVASNPHTPLDCLESLLEDPDFRVRGEAERNLSRGVQETVKNRLDQLVLSAQARQAANSFPCDQLISEPEL